MTKTLEPLGGRIVVRPRKQETQTKSGLFIPEAALEVPQEVEVIAVGPGDRNEAGERVPVDVAVGDVVVIPKYAGIQFKSDDDERLIISAKDVAAIVREA